MAIAALIFGLLGLIVFSWLGPLLGAGWSGTLMATSAAGGQMEISTWPVWTLGLGLGAGLPLIAVLFGIIGMKKQGERKGVAITGIVLGVIGVLAGVILSGVFAAGLAVARYTQTQAQAEAQELHRGFEDLKRQFEENRENMEKALAEKKVREAEQ